MIAVHVTRTTVFREPGRFAGWPANYGAWAWGNEILVGFALGHVRRARDQYEGLHPRDTTRPFVPMLARSTDGGTSWRAEPFTGTTPGGPCLSADEHVEAALRAGTRLREDEFGRLPESIDFTDPETIVLCGRTGLAAGARSWFYVGRDRGRDWAGPFALPSFGLGGVAARTDIVPIRAQHALFLLTATKPDGTEGRVFVAETVDGGRRFGWRGWVSTPAPGQQGWSIMPSSVGIGRTVLTAVRRWQGDSHSIELYRSDDLGASWRLSSVPVPDTGRGGNPPAMLRLTDGRLLLAYGARSAPYGLRAVTSDDDGGSWSPPRILTGDAAGPDLGYPRVVQLPDGSVLAACYSNDSRFGDRFVEAVRWSP